MRFLIHLRDNAFMVPNREEEDAYMPAPPYQGVILAAGQGTRMAPLTEYYPKALLPVANVPLVTRHLETLRELGVEECFIVIGHLGDAIRKALGNGAAFDMTIHYVEQGEREGIAHAVGALESHLTGPFILLLGDIYFSFNTPARALDLMQHQNADAVLAVRMEEDPAAVRRNFSVSMDKHGRVRQVIEKPTAVQSLCKGCGFYVFSLALFDAIRRTPRSPLRNEYELTDAIQTLIDDGSPVFATAIVDWDVNLTTPDDLIACSRHALGVLKATQLVGANTTMATGTTLVETVLGDNVEIVRPCRLERCVVLPGTLVDAVGPLRDQVLYPEGNVSCPPPKP